MTALQLLGWITSALLIQLVLGIGIGAVQSRRRAAPVVEQGSGAATSSSSVAVGDWSGLRDFRVVRRVFEDAAGSQCSFYLEAVDGQPLKPFRPGQYLTLSLKVPGIAPGNERRSITRCYSLSDRPDPRSYRITVKRVPPPAGRSDLPPGASSSYLHDDVREGTVLAVKAPSGRFCIDPDPALPVVLIAGGIGITPLLSMASWALLEQPGRPIHLFYGVRRGTEQAFKARLDELVARYPHFHLAVVCSDADADIDAGADGSIGVARGRVDIDLLRRTLPYGRHQFYVCGPPPMMASLIPALKAWGVSDTDLYHEAFGPASLPTTATGPVGASTAGTSALQIRFVATGRTLPWDGRDANLLDFAERNGIAVDSGCRSGSCGTCETTLTAGTVAYADPPDHEIAAGRCLLCVGVPTSDLALAA